MLRLSCCLPLVLFACVYHALPAGEEEPVPYCQPGDVSWQNDILPIMETKCATSGCHDGISRRDWTNYDEVAAYAAAIKTRTQDKSMPFDEPLPQSEIDLIACWIDGGALKN